MIFESMAKYDSEIAKCTEYYATQCTAMEACRSQIAASNYIAANSRALILDAQASLLLSLGKHDEGQTLCLLIGLG